jgi:endonuclease YncB( thermonuclease family)
VRRPLILALALSLALVLYCWAATRPWRPGGEPAPGVRPACAELLLRGAEAGAEIPPECAEMVLAPGIPRAVPAPRGRDAAGRAGPCTVERVVEGEIEASCEGWRGRVRLLHIESPGPGQPGHRRASGVLERYVGGTEVWLDYEAPGEPAWDEYGRLLAYVYAEELNVNVEMVRDGWSRVLASEDPGRLDAELARAEAEARGAQRGLWAAER